MIRIAIVEDERLFMIQLRQFIERYAAGRHLEVDVKLFPDGKDFVEQFRCDYDLIFMDVAMPKLGGFDAAAQIRKKDTNVLLIFVTNMAQFAIRGYEVNALDYIVKPLNYFTFEMKFGKALDQLSLRPTKNVLIHTKEATRRLSYQEITYLEILGHKLYYHTLTDTFLVLGTHTLKEAEQELDSPLFSRCNSCYLVNLSHVESIEGDFAYVAGDTLKISRQRKRPFSDALLAFYEGGIS